MKFNSGQNYDNLYNYNNASGRLNLFYPIYESITLSDSVSIKKIKSVTWNELPVVFFDYASFSRTNFSIGSSDQYDSSYDWFLPLPMKVDWANTSLQIMPTSESEYTDMPNVDGSMVGNTAYKNRAFNFVLYSNDGLNDSEKEEIKQKIVKLLDSTKGSFKRLSIPPNDHYFDVKYSGSASVQDGPSFVKATLPFEVKPYSHSMFPISVIGSGTITNGGLKSCGLKVEIAGSISNPVFTINGNPYRWSSNVPSGTTLVIDSEKMVCYLRSKSSKTNAITYLYPQGKEAFVTIKPGESVSVGADEITKGHVTFSINESYIW